MTKHNKYILPNGILSEDNFAFYNKGKEFWNSNYDIRDTMEDLVRHQLEKSDLFQGF